MSRSENLFVSSYIFFYFKFFTGVESDVHGEVQASEDLDIVRKIFDSERGDNGNWINIDVGNIYGEEINNNGKENMTDDNELIDKLCNILN